MPATPNNAIHRHRMSSRIALFLAAALLISGIFVGAPSEVGAQAVRPRSATVVVETNGAIFEPGTGSQPTPQTIELDCYGKDSQYIIETYSRTGGSGFPAGVSRMRCGNTQWGLRHIEQRHAADWQAKANYTGASWEDLADFAITNTLVAPSSISYRSSNDTWTYRAPMQIWNGSTLVDEYTCVVSVANNSTNIITSYPES